MLFSEDVRENPGTLALAASWIVVFAMLLLVQSRNRVPVSPGQGWSDPLQVWSMTSHRFGDMTWLEVRQGEPWRLVTATLIHYGLIHVALNVLGLINLGRLVEPWYRTGPFLAICLIIGGFGNLTGGLIRQVVGRLRPWLATVAADHHWPGAIERFFQRGAVGQENIHTGGGSTILLGLLALGAVVGWRSRTRIGIHLFRQTSLLLGVTAALGAVLSNLIDNYGHLGGAIVGAAVGLCDRPLLRLSESKAFRRSAWVFVVVASAACLIATVRADRIEVNRSRRMTEVNARIQRSASLLENLNYLYSLYVRSILRSPSFRDPSRELDAYAIAELIRGGPSVSVASKIDPEQIARESSELADVLARLDRSSSQLAGGQLAADIDRLRELGQATFDDPPRYDQAYEFVVCWRSAVKVIVADLNRWNAQRMELMTSAKPHH